MKQPNPHHLYIQSSQRVAIAHSGPHTGQRFVRVGNTHWMPSGMASPAELTRAQAKAACKNL